MRIVYAEKFDVEKELVGERIDYIHHIGFMGCELMYPYLLLNLYKQENYIALYDIEQEKHIGDFFKKGEGPEEFMDFCILNRNNDSSFWVNDVLKKQATQYKISDDEEVAIRKVLSLDYEMNEVYTLFIHEDTSFTYKVHLWNEGVCFLNNRHTTKIFPYNKAHSRSELNNIMTLADCMKNDETKKASLTGTFDQMEIISLHNHPQESFCVTTSRDIKSWDIYKKKERSDLTDYYLSLPRCNDKYIATLHIDNGRKEFLLFDWEGNGRYKYQVKEDLVDFCIDWRRKVIYGTTSNEEIYKYQVPETE